MKPGYTGALLRLVAAVVALAVTLAIHSHPVYAQYTTVTGGPLACPDPDTVKAAVALINSIVILPIVLVALFAIVFNLFGSVSMVAMRLGEFFSERLRYVFELVIIYVLFLMNLEKAITGDSGCATVDWGTLLQSGPVFFRILGWLLGLLGLTPQSGGS